MKYTLGFFCLILFITFPAITLAEHTKTIKPLSSFAGYSGLWDMPNARVLPDWNIRIGSSISSPYYYFHTTLGLFDRIELNGRLTGIQNLPALEPGYGNLKDKAIDVKFLLLKEQLALPAIAIGATDIHGTGLFTSRYLAMSKQIGPLDITLGFGQGMLAGKSRQERKKIASGSDAAFSYLTSNDTDFSLFGGLEYQIMDNLRLTLEYTSIKYEKLDGGYTAKIPWSIGLKYSPWNFVDFSAAYARGQEWSASVLFQFPLEPEGILTWKKQPRPTREESMLRRAARADDVELADIICLALKKDGFSHAKVFISGPKLWVEVENNHYNSPGLALGRAFHVADLVAPERIQNVYLVLVSNEIFQTGLAASRKHLKNFINSTIDLTSFLEFSTIAQDRETLWHDFTIPAGSTPKEARTKTANWYIEIKPQLANLLDDPSGFFKTRLGVDLTGSIYPWKGGNFQARFSIPIYNDISSSAIINEPEPANTDYIDYLSRKSPHLTAYGYDQIFELPGTARARLGLGAFEAAYVGIGTELFKSFQGGAYGIGLESELVWKRNLSNDFELHNIHKRAYRTFFLNLYGQPFGESGVEIGLKIGRFLAGDRGVRIDIGRTFKHFTVGAWYTITDTSDFVSPLNRDYKDKGVFISFPLSAFTDRPAKQRYYYALSPWTRDPGRMVAQFRTLYPFGDERETPMSLKNSIQEIRR